MKCRQTYRGRNENRSLNHGLESRNEKVGAIKQSGGEGMEDQY